MPVNKQSDEYKEYAPLWELVRDCVKGQHAVKAAGELYLSRPEGQTDKGFEAYIKRAVFFDGTGRTAEILHGHVFKDTIQSGEDQITDAFKEWLKNVDGAGTSFKEYMSATTWDSMQTGYGGDLVDYVKVESGTSLADGTGRAFLKWYSAESIYMLVKTVTNGIKKLSLVILREDITDIDPNDEYNTIPTEAYRVLSFDNEGYIQRVYKKAKEGEGINGFNLIETIKPTNNGERFNFIPFYPRPNDTPEKSMLLGLAYENIGHYQLYAELRNGLFWTSIPTPVVENMKVPTETLKVKVTNKVKTKVIEDGVEKEIEKDVVSYEENVKYVTVTMGGHQLKFFYQEDGNGNVAPVNVKFLEYSGAGLGSYITVLDKSMEKMEMLGVNTLRIAQTATAARINQSGELSVLGAFVDSTNNEVTPAVRLMAKWNGIPEEETELWSCNLPTKFNEEEISDQILAIMHSARQSNEIPRSVWKEALIKKGLLKKGTTNEQFAEMIASDVNILSHGVSGD